MNILLKNKGKYASKVSFTTDKMVVEMEDGRVLSIPLEWFSKLRNATSKQLNNWRFIGKGEGIHWEDLDEDISIEALFE